MVRRKGEPGVGSEGARADRFLRGAKGIITETLATSWELLKITIPIVVITKILEELGLIELLSSLLEPVMNLLGLPGTFGLVWATAMLTNLYGAMVVFASFAPELHPTILQVTVLCSIMLIAHSLPLELAITQKAGAPFFPIGLLRVGGAFFYGILLNLLGKNFQSWQEPAVTLFTVNQGATTLDTWIIGQITSFLLIIVVIFCIICVMRVLRDIGVLTLLEKGLQPILPYFGMTRNAAPVTVVGMVMGISYGGALIIREANSGKMEKREVFYSLALMGLSHSLVEDTLLMVALGGHIGGLLVGRLIFSLVIISLLVKIINSINFR